MTGYTPLFSSIVTSSIWNEDSETRVVWITMLALADANGKVEGSISGLAPVARVSLEACEKAINRLMQPDPYSRTKNSEGKRIKEIDGGWQILNLAKFRQKAKSRAEYLRKWREEKEKNQTQTQTNTNTNINTNTQTQTYTQTQTRKHLETPCNTLKHLETVSYTIEQIKDALVLNEIPESNAQSYFDQYNSQGWKKGNGQLITNLRSHISKRWNKSKQCWDFDERKFEKKETIKEQIERMKKEGKL